MLGTYDFKLYCLNTVIIELPVTQWKTRWSRLGFYPETVIDTKTSQIAVRLSLPNPPALSLRPTWLTPMAAHAPWLNHWPFTPTESFWSLDLPLNSLKPLPLCLYFFSPPPSLSLSLSLSLSFSVFLSTSSSTPNSMFISFHYAA